MYDVIRATVVTVNKKEGEAQPIHIYYETNRGAICSSHCNVWTDSVTDSCNLESQRRHIALPPGVW
jgi:hypothetical protein